MTPSDPVEWSVQQTIERLLFDYPDLPVTVVVRTATTVVRSVQAVGDLDRDPGPVGYWMARRWLDSVTSDTRDVARRNWQPRSPRSA